MVYVQQELHGSVWSIRIVNGTGITFFICNETEFNHWTDGHEIEACEFQEDVTSGEHEFLSYGGRWSGIRWYLVFDNTDDACTAQTMNTELYIDLVEPTIECNVNDDDVLSGIWNFDAAYTKLVLIQLNVQYVPLAIPIRLTHIDGMYITLKEILPSLFLMQSRWIMAVTT